MFSALAVATLLAVSDPVGDTFGNGRLAAPTATLFRQSEAFDIRGAEVSDTETLTLSVTLTGFRDSFPEALLELYLTNTESGAGPGTEALLEGSGMSLPEGQAWHYAVRLEGSTLHVFDGRSGQAREFTRASGAKLSVSGNTLTVQTALPRPRDFSLYGMSGSYDPFSETGWRALRETPSPWGFSGAQSYPVLDVVAETSALQEQALAQGVLPEIQASFAEQGWLLVAGAGVVLTIASMVVRTRLKRRPVGMGDATWITSHRLESGGSGVSLAPLGALEIERRRAALNALQWGAATLSPRSDEPAPEAEAEPVLS